MAITTYKVTSDNVLDITWEAETDKPTIINQTNHNYYNLSGDFTQPGYDMVLYVNADNFTPSDTLYIPTGEISRLRVRRWTSVHLTLLATASSRSLTRFRMPVVTTTTGV